MRVAFLGNFGVDYSSESHHAKSLEQLGCHVVRMQEPSTPAPEIESEAISSDMFVWIKTHGWETPGIESAIRSIKDSGVPVVSYHLDAYLQIPDRWARYKNDPYMHALDHFFTVDACLADWLNRKTEIKGHYLPPGVYGDECYISPRPSAHANDVLFVGSYGYHPSYPMRPKLINWLHSTYGERFTHVGGGGSIGTVRGDDLNRLYSNSKVCVGDSYICDPLYRGKYWSDRIPETLGRGGFLLHPWVYGLDEQFKDGEHLVTYEHGDFGNLKMLIDHYLVHETEREAIRRSGHKHAKREHAYTARWQQIIHKVFV